jgi:hypothetical protein
VRVFATYLEFDFSAFFSLARQGGKKELMREAQLRREDLGKRADTDVREVRTCPD